MRSNCVTVRQAKERLSQTLSEEQKELIALIINNHDLAVKVLRYSGRIVSDNLDELSGEFTQL